MSIAAKLLHLDGTKTEIRTAIEEKGVVVDALTPFRDYADKIREITAGEADIDLDADVSPETGLYSWGGSLLGSLRPMSPAILTEYEFDQIVIGYDHGLAIKDGKLYSWGNNYAGKTGQGTTSGETLTPTQIGTETDWWKITAGYDHSFGIRKTWNELTEQYDYTLWGFGRGTNGRLGNGTTTFSNTTPLQIGTDIDWSDIVASYNSSAGIRGGVLYTCGQNYLYKTGLNTSTGDTITWATADALDTGFVSCLQTGFWGGAIKSNGELWTWGYNHSLRAGHPSESGSYIVVPTKVGTDTDWAMAKGSSSHGGGIKTDGKLFMWGSQDYGKFGNGVTSGTTEPIQIGTATDWEVLFLAQTSGANDAFSLAIKGGEIWGAGVSVNGLVFIGGNTQIDTWANVFAKAGAVSLCGSEVFAVAKFV